MRTFSGDLAKLSLAEKLELLEKLCESIAADPEHVPVPEWHLRELNRRERPPGHDSAAGRPWEVVKARVCGNDRQRPGTEPGRVKPDWRC